MSTVDKTICDALSKRQTVVLPGVGSLVVKTRGARKMPGDRIIPPQNVVAFSEEENVEGASIVALLVAYAGMDERDARGQYGSWLEGARSGKGYDIDGAGEIRDGRFIIAQPLHTALNPAEGEEPIIMKKEKKGGRLWLWILLALAVSCLAVVVLSRFGVIGDYFGIRKAAKPDVEVVAPVVAPEPEPVVDMPAIVAEPAFHVIAGSFGVESNADNHVKKLKREFPELPVQKITNTRNGRWLVSIFNAPTERQAYNKMNMYWDIDLDLWVYEQK